MAPKKLTVLFTPLNAWGHINCCHSLAEGLKDRGHRVVFAIDKSFQGKLKPFGFEEIIHGSDEIDENYWPNFIQRYLPVLKLKPIDVVREFDIPGLTTMFEDIKKSDNRLSDIIANIKPDVIIVDNYICSPVLTNAGIPWVWLYSAAPHGAFNDERIPPAQSGLPLNGDKNQWKEFRDEFRECFKGLAKEVSDYCVSKGAPKLPEDRLHPISPYLNIYLYPKELDFEELKPFDRNWIRVENFIRTTNETFIIPEVISDSTGKVVFLSMGSFGCANLDLMMRLTTILGNSKHKFIVSKGPLHDKYELPANMWGQAFLPQTAVLPVVDLVITHGGNNTVTETFYFGKPMLVMPMFGDQLDNAQRIQETGLGIRLNPFHCSEEELLSSVDKLLSDQSLAERMTAIGQRIRNRNDKQLVSQLIEGIVEPKH